MPKLLGGAADSSLPVPFLAPPFSSKFNIQLLAGGHRIRYRWRLVGDITPIDGVNTNNWLGKASSKEIKDCEYEDHEATDSEFVHDVDKIELILQMVEYDADGGTLVKSRADWYCCRQRENRSMHKFYAS
jgi:hypothetical protein